MSAGRFVSVVGAVAVAGCAAPAAPCLTCVPPDAAAATVVRVVDGDTVVLRVRGRSVRVRLIGVDAPETWPRRDCFGAEATRALRRLVPPGARVRAAGDVEPYDRYGRRLLYLWTARGAFVDAALVRGGFARALAVPPDTSRAEVLYTAENTARHRRAGLWRACATGPHARRNSVDALAGRHAGRTAARHIRWAGVRGVVFPGRRPPPVGRTARARAWWVALAARARWAGVLTCRLPWSRCRSGGACPRVVRRSRWAGVC